MHSSCIQSELEAGEGATTFYVEILSCFFVDWISEI